MTIRPVVDVPSSLCVGDMVMYLDTVSANTVSPYSLMEQNYLWPGRKWRIDFNLANTTNRIIANQWKAFGAKCKGTYGMFLMGDPGSRVAAGVGSGSPLVDGAGQVGDELDIKNCPPNVTGWLLAGDMVQVGTSTDSRLYMNLEDVNTDGAGKATLKLHTDLRISPNNNVAVTVQNAKGVFCLSQSTFSWRQKPGPVWNIAFQAEEVIGA